MTLKATVPTRAGAASGKTTGVPPPASTLNARAGTTAGSPNAGARFSPVTGSVISSVTSPVSAAVPALLTMTRRSAVSPSRKKRGRYGRTMRSLTLFASASSVPPSRSRVTPWTKTRQLVTESGTVNSIVAVPSAPVSRCGCQKAVSAKFERSSAPAWPSAAASLPANASSFSFASPGLAALPIEAGGAIWA